MISPFLALVGRPGPAAPRPIQSNFTMSELCAPIEIVFIQLFDSIPCHVFPYFKRIIRSFCFLYCLGTAAAAECIICAANGIFNRKRSPRETFALNYELIIIEMVTNATHAAAYAFALVASQIISAYEVSKSFHLRLKRSPLSTSRRVIALQAPRALDQIQPGHSQATHNPLAKWQFWTRISNGTISIINKSEEDGVMRAIISILLFHKQFIVSVSKQNSNRNAKRREKIYCSGKYAEQMRQYPAISSDHQIIGIKIKFDGFSSRQSK